MAEYTLNAVQEIAVNGSAIFNDSIPCNKGFIYHRNESGIFILRGIVNNPTSCFGRYQLTFNGNIAIPTGQEVTPISMAISIGGEAIQTSNAIVTPAEVDNYFNITSTAFIDVPKNCCFSIAVENTSTIPVNLQNANLVIMRVA